MIISLELLIFFALLSLAASFVNGGLGYGYSSLSVPLAILVIANKIINPVYVLVEAAMNTTMLAFVGKANIKATFRRVLPVVLPVVPGVILGSYLLSIVAPIWIRFIVYSAILPLILLQATGFRKPIKKESTAGVPLGMGIGLLYSITTISGPPIAIFWSNQGMAKNEFKAAVLQVRIAESYLTCISYFALGLFTLTTFQLFSITAPPILLGIPLGMLVVRKLAVETFGRFTRAFDAAIVGFGLSQVLLTLFKQPAIVAYSFWALVLAIDGFLLYKYLRTRPRKAAKEPVPIPVLEPPQKA
ncbi:MAG: sulfite exporter TauE/SafE family protein [Thaumarchaeota archaeon]|nr:sulfite exporter TauE/SafE family protein [Nitrososphaerota archaeon]